MILSSLNKVADVTLNSSSRCLPRDIAGMVWSRMRTINQDDEARPATVSRDVKGAFVGKATKVSQPSNENVSQPSKL